MNTVTVVAASCTFVYLTARLIFMAYYAERTAHIRTILKIAKEQKRQHG